MPLKIPHVKSNVNKMTIIYDFVCFALTFTSRWTMLLLWRKDTAETTYDRTKQYQDLNSWPGNFCYWLSWNYNEQQNCCSLCSVIPFPSVLKKFPSPLFPWVYFLLFCFFFPFLRLHRPQHLHNIEFGGQGYQRINISTGCKWNRTRLPTEKHNFLKVSQLCYPL